MSTRYLDHLLTSVPALDQAAEVFARMGFRLTPISHLEPMGLANRLILMSPSGPGRANYIEIMAPYDRSRLAPAMASVLSGSPGTKSMVFASNDLEAFQQAAATAGFRITPPLHVRREWKIPGEPSVFPEFDVILPVEAALRFNACRYYDLNLYLRPDWLQHPNGAVRVSTCFVVSDRPESLLPYAQVFGRAAHSLAGGAWCFPGGEIDLVALPAQLAQRRFGLAPPPADPGFLGYEIKVASLPHLHRHLLEAQIPFRAVESAICVDPQTAFGNLILFTQSTPQELLVPMSADRRAD